MKKPILTDNEFLSLGFQSLDGEELDHGEYYKWWVLYKNDNELHVTYEFNNKGELSLAYVEFNGEKLKGRELTKKDIEFLIEIM